MRKPYGPRLWVAPCDNNIMPQQPFNSSQTLTLLFLDLLYLRFPHAFSLNL